MARREEGGGDVIATPAGPGIPEGTTRRDKGNPTQLGTNALGPPKPFVDPNITDPQALRYAQAAEQRRRPVQIPRYTDPVAGGADVPIPPLNADAIGGMPMSQQAVAMRGGQPQMPMPSFAPSPSQEPALVRPAGMPAPSGIVSGVEHLGPPPPPPRSGGLVMPGGIMPTDTLPPTAQTDPMFRQGQGAMVAANQPELAYKYGVMRNGQYVAPQALKAPTSPRQVGGAAKGQPAQLSQQTLAGLQAVQDFNNTRERAESGGGSAAVDRKIAAEAEAGPAGGAGATRAPLSEGEKKNILDEMDEFDITRLRNAIYKDLLNNDEQKKLIEARLKPLDLSDLILSGRVTQIVPIVPNKFEPEFQSYSGDEDLYVKRLLGMEMENLKPLNTGFERYVTDKYTLMGLTVAVKAINKVQFETIYDVNGNWDEAKFWAKYKVISNFNYHMIGSLVVNWFWFDLRVRYLFKAEALGNG
jgi:hypothetical protein